MDNIGTIPPEEKEKQAVLRRYPLSPLDRTETSPADLMELFLGRLSPYTRRAYAADLRDFAEWCHAGSSAEAVAVLFSSSQARANRLVFDYMTTMKRIGLSPATLNRRRAALKSLAKLGRLLGVTTLTIEIPRERDEAYRDTRGPTVERVREILADLQAKADGGNNKALRDVAMVRLLWNPALRCHEVVGLNMEHFDRAGPRLSILGKGRRHREWITIPPKTVAALEKWLAFRGDSPGPLFVSVHRARSYRRGVLRKKLARLHREDVYRATKPYGVHPHGFRHSAITTALEMTNGNLADVQRFSRHMNPATVQIYNDRRLDAAGQIAARLDDVA